MKRDQREFDRFVAETHFSLKVLHRFVTSSERGISFARDEELRELNERTEKISGQFIPVLGEKIDHALAYEKFPTILRYSHIITAFSFYEVRLKEFCREIVRRSNENGSALKIDGNPQHVATYETFLWSLIDRFDENGDGDEYYLEFGERTKVIERLRSIGDWLNFLRLIRNCIAHCSGNIEDLKAEDDKTEIRRHTGDGKRGVTEVNGLLLIESHFVVNSVSIIAEFFEKMFNEVGFGLGWAAFPGYHVSEIILGEMQRRVEGLNHPVDEVI